MKEYGLLVGCLIFCLLILVTFCAGFSLGKRLGEGVAAAEAAKAAKQLVADVAAADERARAAEKKLDDELRKQKPAQPDVAEAVNADPSTCVVQPPVADRLRRAIRESNEGAR